MATHLPRLTISCDQADIIVTPTLEIFESEASSLQDAVQDQPAQPSSVELPPPNRFRRDQFGKKFSNLDLKVQAQNHKYLVAYRETIGRLLTEACSTARPVNQDEVQKIARQMYCGP